MKTDNSSYHQGKLNKYRNEIAALLSIIPGLGHIYKGYLAIGLSLLLLSLVFVYSGVVLALATGGFGLFLPVIYIMVIGWHAYAIKDHRKHHIGVL